MVKTTVLVKNESGLHARPASLFVKQAQRFRSEIKICLDEKNINAKSLVAVLTLGAVKGSEIEICAEGEDEQQAVQALADVLNSELE